MVKVLKESIVFLKKTPAVWTEVEVHVKSSDFNSFMTEVPVI